MFMGLGDIPGGRFYSAATAVSADGSTVVGYSESGVNNPGGTPRYQAFRWTAASVIALGDLPGGNFYSEPYAVSSDGSVVAGYSSDAEHFHQAFRWTEDNGMVSLGRLPPPGVNPGGFAGGNYAQGMSADGSVIVGGGQGEAFRWTASDGMVGLGLLPGDLGFTLANGVSADGSVVVGWGTNASSLEEAFRWTAGGGMVGLGDLPGGGFGSYANAVSADGSVIVGSSRAASDYTHAFRWTAGGGMQDLGLMPGYGSWATPPLSVATGVSADGSVVVGFASSPTSNEAFIWDEVNGMRQLDEVLAGLGLDLGDWTLTMATDISADGLTIVGRGQHPFNGVTEGWIAVIPEPSTGLLLMSGLLGLAYRQRRHRQTAQQIRP
jgi:probable HAF family extracellular repeat protein